MSNCFNRTSLRRLSRRSSTSCSNLINILPDEIVERICLFTIRCDLSQDASDSFKKLSSLGADSPLWLTRNNFVAARPLLLLNKRFHRAVYSIVTRFSFFMINGWLDLQAPGLLTSLRHCTNLQELQLVIHDDPTNFSVHNLHLFLASTKANIHVVHLSWGTASHRAPCERSPIVDRTICVVAKDLGPKLRSLAMDCCGTIELSAAAMVGLCCPNLKHLALAYTYFEEWTVFRAFSNLQELHIRNADVDDNLLTSISISLRILESLSLTFYRSHLLECFRNLKSLPRLKTVHLTRFNMGLADEELAALANFPQLEYVRLRYMHCTPSSLNTFLTRTGSRLRSLWINDKWLGILAMGKSSPSSRRFSCPVTAATGVLATAQTHCPNLLPVPEEGDEQPPHWSQRPYVEALQCVVYRGDDQQKLTSSPRFAVCDKLRNCFNTTVTNMLNSV